MLRRGEWLRQWLCWWSCCDCKWHGVVAGVQCGGGGDGSGDVLSLKCRVGFAKWCLWSCGVCEVVVFMTLWCL